MTNPTALQFLRKLDEAEKYYIPHHMLLSHNQQTGAEDNMNHSELQYEDFSYHCSLPLPISDYCVPTMEDPSKELVTKKEQWHRDIKALRILHRDLSSGEKIQKIIYSSRESTEVPLYILKFAKLLKENPDEYFDSHFNWYMSGAGNLCTVSSFHPECVFIAIGSELRIQYFNGHITEELDSKETTKYVCENMKPINETILCQTSQKQIIGLRQRNKIHLVNFVNTDKHKFELVAIHNSSVPLASTIFDKFTNDILYSDVNSDVHQYNIEENTSSILDKCSSEETLINVNNWSCLHAYNDNSIIKVDRKNLSILDRRKQYCSLNVSPLLGNGCDYIISAQLSLNPYCINLGTMHNLYQCDIRYVKCNKPQLNKWTHGLKSPPIFMSNFNYDNDELIALASQLSDEICLINNHNYYNHDKFATFDVFNETEFTDFAATKPNILYLPRHMPSIVESYNNSRKKGFCLDPTINIRHRLSFSRTGLNYFKTDDGVQLLSLNAAGDVFSQRITLDSQEPLGCNEYKTMEKWAEKFRISRFPFILSSQVNLKYFQTKMKRPSNPKIRGRRSEGLICTNKNWKKSLNELYNYSDMWANELLSIWDIKEVNQGIDHLLPPPVDTKFKIDSWVNQFPMDLDEN